MSSLVRLACSLSIALALAASSGAAIAKPSKAAAAKIDGKAKVDKNAKADGKKNAKKADKNAKNGKKGAQSIGAPNSGHLVGAARLKQSKTLKQRVGAHSWGLPEMVKLLHHASDAVARKHRGSVMLVGDVSGRTGGHLDGHGSHQTGRDADVGFYVMNSRGKGMPVKRFIAFDGAGHARDLPWASFDDARNWAMVEAFLKFDKATVRYLFITNELRARLLAYATKKNVSKELITRAASVMMSPRDADMHDDHFHVRIACPGSMHDVCVEEASAREARVDAADEKENAAEPKGNLDAAPPAHAKDKPAGDKPADKPVDKADAPKAASDAK